MRLVLAALLGLVVTAAHTRIKSQRTAGHSLARAQTLLCVAGALTMILIDNSVARAFGIAGAASIIRFRTPVEDPTDATVMFLLMALGMACGIGAFGVAATGAVGVSALLIGFGTLAPEPAGATWSWRSWEGNVSFRAPTSIASSPGTESSSSRVSGHRTLRPG